LGPERLDSSPGAGSTPLLSTSTKEVMSGPTSTVPTGAPDWRSVADQLAGALEEAMLRNPGLTADGWARAHAALGRYEHSAGADRADLSPLPDPPEPVTA
jgi:hypothetical protein